MRLVPFCLGLGQGHGLGRFTGHTNMVKVDGMVAFVLRGDDDDGVARNLFVNGDVNAQKKTDDEQAYDHDNGDFTFFPGLHRHKALKSDWGKIFHSLQVKNVKVRKPNPSRCRSVLFFALFLWQGNLEEFDFFLPQGLFFVLRRRATDAFFLRHAVMHFQGFFREVGAHVLEVLVDIFDNFMSQPLVVDGRGLDAVFRFGTRGTGRHGGDHFLDSTVTADRTGYKVLGILIFKRPGVVKPTFKPVTFEAFQIKDDHVFPLKAISTHKDRLRANALRESGRQNRA